MRVKFLLSIQQDLREQIKIQAVRENRDVSDITEDLYREYLDRQKNRGAASEAMLKKRERQLKRTSEAVLPQVKSKTKRKD